MARLSYFIALHDRKWKIFLDGSYYGPFPSKSFATRVAIDAAFKCGKNGDDTRVLVQDKNNEWIIEWAYGRDPFPRKAHRRFINAFVEGIDRIQELLLTK